MKKQRILLVAVTALLASCTSNSGGGDTPKTSEDSVSDKFTLQIFTGGYGDAPWKYALKEFDKLYGDKYTVIANMDNNVNKTFADRWKNGNEPDFVFLDGSDIDKPNWLSEGLLEDLTPWLETAKVQGEDTLIKDKVDSSYWVKYTDSNSKKTTTYGAPLLLNAYGMWYDDALFSEKKWTMPKNYNELKTFAGKATNEIRNLIYPGVFSGYLTQGMLVPAFAEMGDEFFNRVMNCLDADVYESAEFKEVMNRFNEYISLNQYTVSECLSLNHTSSQMEWLGHKAALIPNGLWLRSEMSKADNGNSAIPDGFNMRFSPSPLVKSKQSIVTSSITCAVASNAKNKKAAKEFLSILYRDDVQKQFVYASDSPSVVKLDLENDKNVTDVLKYTQEVFNNPNYAHKANNGSWGGVDKAINDAVNSLVKAHLSGTTYTVDDACKAIKAAAVQEINDRNF